VGLVAVLHLGDAGMSLRESVRELLNYPHFFVFWGFPNEWMLLSIVASIGMLWAFEQVARPSGALAPRPSGEPPAASTAAAGFMLLALAVPLIANGLFATSFELFRYNASFDFLYFVFVALAFVHWRDVASELAPGLRFDGRAGLAVTAALVLLAVAVDLNPVRGVLAAKRDYVNDGWLYRVFELENYRDFKSTAAYVSEHAASEDLILTPDSREFYNYIGRVDYWLRSARYLDQSYERNGVRRDLYVDTPLLATHGDFQAVLDRPNRAKWVIASRDMLNNPNAPIAAETKAYLLSQESRIVYVGRDRDRTVYRFD
jgi:hypothetical protein